MELYEGGATYHKRRKDEGELEFIYFNEKIIESERQDQKLPPIYSKQRDAQKYKVKKPYLGHFYTSTRQYDRQNGKFNIDKKRAIILIGMRI